MGQTESLSWLITSELPEELRKAKDTARREADLNRVVVVESQSFPGGVLRTTLHYQGRLGDLFDSVNVSTDEKGFSVEFCPANDANRFWKDIMVRMLRAIRHSGRDISIKPIEHAR
jgi:hypothetical protein